MWNSLFQSGFRISRFNGKRVSVKVEHLRWEISVEIGCGLIGIVYGACPTIAYQQWCTRFFYDLTKKLKG
jgi:hypothetical protein